MRNMWAMIMMRIDEIYPLKVAEFLEELYSERKTSSTKALNKSGAKSTGFASVADFYRIAVNVFSGMIFPRLCTRSYVKGFDR